MSLGDPAALGPVWARSDVRDSDIWSQRFRIEPDSSGPLDGRRCAVKDLFDVAGFPTLAGRAAMLPSAPAVGHAASVQRLLSNGASLVGHTTMTQLAFSGIGQNPEFGQSRSLWSPDGQARLAGGSSRGSALAVAAGQADIGLGTDTGGSCRIPAACNGLFGFKPTASRVNQAGARPLGPSLDSVGLMTRDLASGVQAMSVLFESPRRVTPIKLLRVPEFAVADLDPAVQSAFDALIDRLQASGFTVDCQPLPCESNYLGLLASKPLVSAEAFALYPDPTGVGVTDPRVVKRIEMGEDLDAEPLYEQRRQLKYQFPEDVEGCALLMPTLPWLPPTTAFAEHPDNFDAVNAQALRNSALINLADGCAISLPIDEHRPISVTVAGAANCDESIYALAAQLRTAIGLD